MPEIGRRIQMGFPPARGSNGTGIQPTFRVSNPNLRPWVKEQMKKDNDEVLAEARAASPPGGKIGGFAVGRVPGACAGPLDFGDCRNFRAALPAIRMVLR
jgi:hypothetical protein